MMRSGGQQDHVVFSLRCHGEQYLIRTSAPPVLAFLNCKIAAALNASRVFKDVRLEAYMPQKDLTKVLSSAPAGTSSSQNFRVNINVVGRKTKGTEIGTVLSKSGFYLQDPILKYDDIQYYNPHILRFNDVSDEDVLVYQRDTRQAFEYECESNSLDYILDNLQAYQAGKREIKNDRLIVALKTFVNITFK